MRETAVSYKLSLIQRLNKRIKVLEKDNKDLMRQNQQLWDRLIKFRKESK